jgi:hypothetical protein
LVAPEDAHRRAVELGRLLLPLLARDDLAAQERAALARLLESLVLSLGDEACARPRRRA